MSSRLNPLSVDDAVSTILNDSAQYGVVFKEIIKATQALFAACESGSVADAKAAIASRANINSRWGTSSGAESISQEEYDITPLFIACLHGHEELATLLISQPKIDVNLPGPQGITPLHVVCQKGPASIAKALLGHPKIDVMTYDSNGAYPLVTACIYGRDDIVKLLLAEKASAIQQPEVCLNGVTGAPVGQVLARLHHLLKYLDIDEGLFQRYRNIVKILDPTAVVPELPRPISAGILMMQSANSQHSVSAVAQESQRSEGITNKCRDVYEDSDDDDDDEDSPDESKREYCEHFGCNNYKDLQECDDMGHPGQHFFCSKHRVCVFKADVDDYYSDQYVCLEHAPRRRLS